MTLEQIRRALRGHVPVTVDDPEAKPAAVAIIVVQGDDGAETLFIHRAVRPNDPWSGQIAFPGGRREPSDTDLQATAIRETLEEVGIDLAGAERLGVLSDLHPRTPVLPPIFVRPFVFGLAQKPAVTLSSEVQGAFWVPFHRFTEPGVQLDVAISIAGADRRFPAYVLGDHVIWGMTERILTPLLEAVSKA